jgi:hypothetical protein
MHPARRDDAGVEAAIRDVLGRYCRGIDRLDRELVLACYHPDAVDHHPGFEGPADAFVDWCFDVLGRFRSTSHLLGQTVVDRRDDRPDVAVVETYAVAHHHGTTDAPARNLEAGIRYVDRFERRPAGEGAWRIAERFVVVDWQRVVRAEDRWPLVDGAAGQRGADDTVHRLLTATFGEPPGPTPR